MGSSFSASGSPSASARRLCGFVVAGVVGVAVFLRAISSDWILERRAVVARRVWAGSSLLWTGVRVASAVSMGAIMKLLALENR